MSQAMLQRLDGYEACCGAFRTPSGRYAPVYKLFEGAVSSGGLVHKQCSHTCGGDEYATEIEAFHAAAEMAIEWLQAHRAP
jgi:hypothetical protein